MSKFEIKSDRDSVAIWDGWNHRFFASTIYGWKGWYNVLCVPRDGTRNHLVNAPRSRRVRPAKYSWRRDEVKRVFGRLVQRNNELVARRAQA